MKTAVLGMVALSYASMAAASVIGPSSTAFRRRERVDTRRRLFNKKASELLGAKRQQVTCSADERVACVQMYEKGSKSVSDFCRENDLPDATLSLWRRQLRGPSETSLGEDGGIVELPVAKGG